jgi:plasmid stabilization system protein ParE
MAYKIDWTEEALEDMQKLLNYLIAEWSYDIADKFEELTELRLQTLIQEPLIGKVSEINNSTRFIILTKHNKLYYRIKGDVIIIVNIFDTRQNPLNNRFE